MTMQTTYETTPDRATRDAIASHASDIRFYGMGSAYTCDIVRAMGANGLVKVEVCA